MDGAKVRPTNEKRGFMDSVQYHESKAGEGMLSKCDKNASVADDDHSSLIMRLTLSGVQLRVAFRVAILCPFLERLAKVAATRCYPRRLNCACKEGRDIRWATCVTGG
jgi:hypothetical protein